MKSAPSWPGSSGRHGSCSSFHSLLFSLGLFTVCLDKMNTHVYCCYTWIFARALVPHMLSFGWLESNVNRHYNCRLMFQDICGLFRKAVLHFLYRLSFSDLTAPVGKTFFFWCNQELVHPLIMRWDDCSHLKSVFTLAQTELESPADRGRAEQSPNIWDNCDGANDETSEISSNCNCSFFFFFCSVEICRRPLRELACVWSKWNQLPLPAVNSWHLSWPKDLTDFFQNSIFSYLIFLE